MRHRSFSTDDIGKLFYSPFFIRVDSDGYGWLDAKLTLSNHIYPVVFLGFVDVERRLYFYGSMGPFFRYNVDQFIFSWENLPIEAKVA